MAGHNLQARLDNIEKDVVKALAYVDKAKVHVLSDDIAKSKQYFLDKGYTAESIVEVEDSSKLCYLIIGRNPNA